MRWCLALLWCLFTAALNAGELPDFSKVQIDGVIHSAVGVTRRDTPIDLFGSGEDSSDTHDKERLVLIGGFDGDLRSVTAALETLRWFYTHKDSATIRKRFTLAVISCGNPDGLLLDKGVENGRGGQPGFLADSEKRYLSQTNVEKQYLDGWIEQHAPRYVFDLRAKHPENANPNVLCLEDGSATWLLMSAIERLDLKDTAPARARLRERVGRDNKTFTQQIAGLYSVPKSKAYYDTLPLLASQRLREAGVDVPSKVFDWGEALPKSGSELSGLLYLVGRQKELSADEIALLRRAAEMAFDKEGKPLKEPPFHNQMSDAVFMNGPILASVGKLTGEERYFNCCAQQQAFVRKLCKRADGLYRHSPLCEAAWGRGNGFVAMGNTLMLEAWPEDHPERKMLLAEYQAHMAALLKHQDYTGTWHQVIDRPESYREFTCTSMIGFAMASGVRHGWLDAKHYQPAIDRAWAAAKARTSDQGEFVDVCTGTGKQKTLRDYYDREAINGRDARGGAMMLMFASEMLRR